MKDENKTHTREEKKRVNSSNFRYNMHCERRNGEKLWQHSTKVLKMRRRQYMTRFLLSLSDSYYKVSHGIAFDIEIIQ